MPFPLATGYFVNLSFSHVSFKSPVFCLAMEQAMSQSTTFCAGNAAMCFLPYVLLSERTETALRSSEGYVLRRQANRICAGWTTADVAKFQKLSLPEDMTMKGNEGCGTRTDRYFLQKHVFSLCGEEILPQN